MSERLAKNFSSAEFKCTCGCGRTRVDEKLIQGLQKLRDKLGVAIIVTSGFRCPDKNKAAGGVSNSLHLTGQAADITAGVPLRRLYFECVGIKEFGGCGIYPDQNFIHVDSRSNLRRWGKLDGRYVNVTKALDALKERRKQDDTEPDIVPS
jgi:hypothetical protein